MLTVKNLLLSSITFIGVACSSSHLYPPQETSERSAHPWATHLDTSGPEACKKQWALTPAEVDFPAREVIYYRLLRDCNLGAGELLSLWEQEMESFPSYIQRSLFQVSFEQAMAKKMPDQAAGFAYQLAQIAERQDERIQWLQKTKELATLSSRLDLLSELPALTLNIAPHLIENPSAGEKYAVARDSERQRNFKRARRLYLEIMKDPNWDYKERIKAYDRYAMSFKLERDKETYTKETAKTFKWLMSLPKKTRQQQKNLEERWIEWARAEWTQERLQKGHDELVKLTRADFTSPEAKAKSFWLLGMMERERGNLTLAYAFFELGARLQINDSDTKEKIEWSIAWNRFLAGEYSKAIPAFERARISAHERKDDNALRFIYWLARSYEAIGNNTRAHELFQEIVQKNPASYYTLLAYQRLNAKQAPIPYYYPKASELDPKASWIAYMNENEILKEYLRSVRGIDKTLAVTPFFSQGRAYREGMLAGFRLQGDYEFEEISALLYPQAYQEEFKTSAQSAGLSPYLMMAIARQESSFDTNARSFADAFGLMQIIPEKARVLAKRAGLNYQGPIDLYRPAVNIPLASTMLKGLLAKYDGHLVGAIASYNAGEAPVRRWLETRFDGDWEQFVESIPYEETRKYVKLVLRNYFVYRAMDLKEESELPRELQLGLL